MGIIDSLNKAKGKLKSRISDATAKVLPGRSVQKSTGNALYYKDSNILGTASSGITSCKVIISCEEMQELINVVKKFKETHHETVFKNLKNNIDSISTNNKKDTTKNVENACKTYQNDINTSKIPLNINVSVDLGKSIRKEGEKGSSGILIEIDIKQKTITVKHNAGKLVTEVKNLCVVENYNKTNDGFNCTTGTS